MKAVTGDKIFKWKKELQPNWASKCVGSSKSKADRAATQWIWCIRSDACENSVARGNEPRQGLMPHYRQKYGRTPRVYALMRSIEYMHNLGYTENSENTAVHAIAAAMKPDINKKVLGNSDKILVVFRDWLEGFKVWIAFVTCRWIRHRPSGSQCKSWNCLKKVKKISLFASVLTVQWTF